MNKLFLDKADLNTPKLFDTEITTDRLVTIESNNNLLYGYAAKPAGTAPEVLSAGESILLDFGTHCVGHLSFRMRHDIGFLDAPVRLKLKFGETPYEMARDFASCKANLCHSWLQEEIITLDEEESSPCRAATASGIWR